tara:strand:+ start:201 stop:2531 length:2331 start_codon:yes stop_codon:yes gene_type:complete
MIIKNKIAYLVTLASVILNVFLFWSGSYDYLEKKLYDYRFRIRGPLSGDYISNLDENFQSNKAIKLNKRDNDVVILGLDQTSYEIIGRYYPYDREIIWSKVIDNLVLSGAKVIVFDIMFDHISQKDSILSNSIKNAESKGVKVVLAANNIIETGIANKNFRLIKPSHKILDNNEVEIGLVGTINDNDGFVRRYISVDNNVDIVENKYFSLALKAVESYRNSTIRLDDFGFEIGDLKVNHFNNENTFLINYYGPTSSNRMGTFQQMPLYSILDDCDPDVSDCIPILKNPDYGVYEDFFNQMLNDSRLNCFNDKIVIIGSVLKEHHDVFNTPFNSYDNSGEMYGVELHANVIQQILDNNHIQTNLPLFSNNLNFYAKLMSLIINLIFAYLVLLTIKFLKPIFTITIICIMILSWVNISIGAFINDYLFLIKTILGFETNLPDLNQSTIVPVIYPIASILLSYAFNLSYKLYTENLDKKFLKDTFGNYISSDLVNEMYNSKKIPELGGKEDYHTVIFSDIANFSTFSEQLSASQLVKLLNEYLTAMTEIIINNGGTIDKYIGDAIVAFYGAPIKVKNHELKASQTVIQMNEKLVELKNKWRNDKEEWPDLVLNMEHRIGINAGSLVTGNMGSKLQMNYTCMGDTVNLCARLESGAKHWGIRAQASESIYEPTKDNFVFRDLGKIQVKGKNKPVNVYELICKKNSLDERINILLNKFELARNLYLNKKWEDAIIKFKECDKIEFDIKSNNPSKAYIRICKYFIANPPKDDWDGTYIFKEK